MTVTLTEKAKEAIERIRNSEASGIGHQDIYGHSIYVDLSVVGLEVVQQLRDKPLKTVPHTNGAKK